MTDQPGFERPACSALAHLEWTLLFPWHQLDGGTALRTGWAERAAGWRAGRWDTAAWVTSFSALPEELSWDALQAAHAAAGNDPSFRTGEAYCRHRRYGHRPGLEKRFAQKLNTDGADDVSPVARSIRGFLDIIHVHPFNDGNARAAYTWLVWSLVSGGRDVPELQPFVRLPFVPANDRIPSLMQTGLS